jgi:hypothetical protein
VLLGPRIDCRDRITGADTRATCRDAQQDAARGRNDRRCIHHAEAIA